MQTVRLNLEHNELVELCAYDNRRLSMRCFKYADNEPAIDLLPRVRYMLRVQPLSPQDKLARGSSLFFTHGLLILPVEEEIGLVRRVAVLNLSEKTVRVSNGREIICHGVNADEQSSPRPESSADACSPRAPLSGELFLSDCSELTFDAEQAPEGCA